MISLVRTERTSGRLRRDKQRAGPGGTGGFAAESTWDERQILTIGCPRGKASFLKTAWFLSRRRLSRAIFPADGSVRRGFRLSNRGKSNRITRRNLPVPPRESRVMTSTCNLLFRRTLLGQTACGFGTMALQALLPRQTAAEQTGASVSATASRLPLLVPPRSPARSARPSSSLQTRPSPSGWRPA